MVFMRLIKQKVDKVVDFAKLVSLPAMLALGFYLTWVPAPPKVRSLSNQDARLEERARALESRYDEKTRALEERTHDLDRRDEERTRELERMRTQLDTIMQYFQNQQGPQPPPSTN